MSFTIDGKDVTEIWIPDVTAAAKYLIAQSTASGEPAQGLFNGAPIVANPSDAPADVVRKWHDSLQDSVDQREQEKRDKAFKEEADRRQSLLNVLMAHIPDHVDGLMPWLKEVSMLADHTGVSVDSERLKQHLISSGYDAQDVKIPGAYDAYSSAMLERHLAAQVIASDRPHGRIVPHLVDLWRKKKAEGF
jgi:hypothetical protein